MSLVHKLKGRARVLAEHAPILTHKLPTCCADMYARTLILTKMDRTAPGIVSIIGVVWQGLSLC